MQSPTQTSIVDYNSVVEKWQHEEPKKMARKLIDKYGPPQEVSRSALVWLDNKPWVRTEIRDVAVRHNFPIPHDDFMWQWVSYPVNVDKTCDCYKLEGSVLLDPTFGEIGGRCHMEEANFLTTNMVYEIMEGKRTWQDAQAFTAKTMMAQEPKNYLTGLVFDPKPAEQARNPGKSADIGK